MISLFQLSLVYDCCGQIEIERRHQPCHVIQKIFSECFVASECNEFSTLTADVAFMKNDLIMPEVLELQGLKSWHDIVGIGLFVDTHA